MDNYKKPYEISLWEDVLTFVYEDGTESYGAVIEGHGAVVAQYYKERKICIIGSNTMDTPIRAHEPKMVSNVNGSHTFTFNMYSHYWDEESEKLVSNPFLKLLINERKIKVREGAFGENAKWYDLIIKDIKEDSNSKVFTYTAKDMFVNELSKSGFNLEFDTELENNTGTVTELGEKILAESDWAIKPGASSIIRQYIEEPLYEIVLSAPIDAYDMMTEKEHKISAGAKIYGFYNCLANKTSYFQFLYAEDGKYEVDDDFVIVSDSNLYYQGAEYDKDGKPSFARSITISDKYRGKRLVRKAVTKYDPTIDEYVAIYKDDEDQDVYGFVETKYVSPASVRSFVTNGSNFTSDTGWTAGASSDGTFSDLRVVSVPDIRDITEANANVITCLKFTRSKNDQCLVNSGIADFRQYIDGFAEGEEYILRVKYGVADGSTANGATSLKGSNVPLVFTICEYTVTEGKYAPIEDQIYFTGRIDPPGRSLDYYDLPLTCAKSLSYTEMITKPKLGLLITPVWGSEATLYFEDVQFFKYVPKTDEESVPPFMLPNEIGQAEIVKTYCYYRPNPTYTSKEDVIYLHKGPEPLTTYTEIYSDNFEKVRSITAKESNRFNLIQDLCEIFECWPRFEIDHNLDGTIVLDDSYRPQKWVSFHEYIGKENFAGFKYGINLKQIQRTIESESVASKIIVKNNSNEFGKNGFCSIARATENPSGENFVLDFSYYIQHGLLNFSTLTNDLYLDLNGYIGYYKKLREINNIRDVYIEEQAGLMSDISDYESSKQVYSTLLNEANENLITQLQYLISLAGLSYDQLMANKQNSWWENEKVIETTASIAYLKTVVDNYGALVENVTTNLTNTQARYDRLTRELSSREAPTSEQSEERRLLLEKEALNKQFYKKYSRFLQEGSWISEDYIDDELYYLDACGTARVSAQPQIKYTIDVIELSQLEGYENYTFSVGDKTTIEDTEFFGWVYSQNGVRTPYREEVVVSETTIEYDSPEKNQIKVQNYKTQFEDLFQRMAATTQSVEYSTGKYNKVSNIVEPDGTISVTTLQNSIANNALTLSNVCDQTVRQDKTGITTLSPANPAEMVRIVSGGIFLTSDGGVTWSTGITGKGINANYITAGQINTDKINIMNGSFPSFRWDGNGLNAYRFTTNNGSPTNFDYGKFVRLDQYGLYGITGNAEFIPSSEEDVRANANFALTWSGFSLKSTHDGGGYISITSDNDFQVFDSKSVERVKIGYLGDNHYGLRLYDNGHNVTLEQASDGKLWLRKELNIGTASTSTVSIGYLDSVKQNTKIHEVFNAEDKFIVYEDGSMRATDGFFQGEINATSGHFTGEINATSGQIGGLSIESITSSVATEYEVQIESDSGSIFKNGEGTKTLIARVYRGFKEITEGLSYQWLRNGVAISGANNKTYSVTWLEESGTEVTYSCKVVMQ